MSDEKCLMWVMIVRLIKVLRFKKWSRSYTPAPPHRVSLRGFERLALVVRVDLCVVCALPLGTAVVVTCVWACARGHPDINSTLIAPK